MDLALLPHHVENVLNAGFLRRSQKSAAAEAYRQGIQVAETNGDKQASREMSVFLKRVS